MCGFVVVHQAPDPPGEPRVAGTEQVLGREPVTRAETAHGVSPARRGRGRGPGDRQGRDAHWGRGCSRACGSGSHRFTTPSGRWAGRLGAPLTPPALLQTAM